MQAMKPIYDIPEHRTLEFEFTVVTQQLGTSQVSRISYTYSYEAPSKTTVWSEISIDELLIYHISSYNVADSLVSNTQPIGRMQKIIYDILISSRPVTVVEHQRTSPTHLWTSKNIVYHI